MKTHDLTTTAPEGINPHLFSFFVEARRLAALSRARRAAREAEIVGAKNGDAQTIPKAQGTVSPDAGARMKDCQGECLPLA